MRVAYQNFKILTNNFQGLKMSQTNIWTGKPYPRNPHPPQHNGQLKKKHTNVQRLLSPPPSPQHTRTNFPRATSNQRCCLCKCVSKSTIVKRTTNLFKWGEWGIDEVSRTGTTIFFLNTDLSMSVRSSRVKTFLLSLTLSVITCKEKQNMFQDLSFYSSLKII